MGHLQGNFDPFDLHILGDLDAVDSADRAVIRNNLGRAAAAYDFEAIRNRMGCISPGFCQTHGDPGIDQAITQMLID